MKPTPGGLLLDPQEFAQVVELTCRHCLVARPSAKAHAACPAFADAYAAMVEKRPTTRWMPGPDKDTPSCPDYIPVAAISTTPAPEAAVRTWAAKAPCSGCAATKGSLASRTAHTQRDFASCVRTGHRFNCHLGNRAGKPCAGWARARLSQLSGASA